MNDAPTLPVPSWTPDLTERWLSANPLPGDFQWPHRDANPDGTPRLQTVIPSYRLHKGYGFWLRTTPYFPGLFEEIHDVLCAIDPLPDDGAALAATLTERLRLRGIQAELFPNP